MVSMILLNQLALHLCQTLVPAILAHIRPALLAIDDLKERGELLRNRFLAWFRFGPNIDNGMSVHGDEVEFAELVLEHLEKVADGL